MKAESNKAECRMQKVEIRPAFTFRLHFFSNGIFFVFKVSKDDL